MITQVMHIYSCSLRPANYAAIPKGWTLLERGTGGFFPLRNDLPEGSSVHGLIGYTEKLTNPEAFDLKYQGGELMELSRA
jgi:hypothetical protein